MQADKHFYGRDIYRDLAASNTRKTVKQMRKAKRYVEKMNKAFKNTPIELTQEQIDIGKRYAESVLKRTV